MDITPVTVHGEYAALPLSQKKNQPRRTYALVSIPDAGRAQRKRWSIQSNGYASSSVRCPDGSYRSVVLHRWLLGLDVGDGQVVDHRNGVRLDCRRENLNLVSPRANAQHRPAVCEPTRGTWLDPQTGKWRAWCRNGEGGKRDAGSHRTRSQAAAAAARLRRAEAFYDGTDPDPNPIA